MVDITYDNVTRCAGGGHFAVDVTVGGLGTRRVVYTTDEVRVPLSALTQDERDQLVLLNLKVHFMGRTRAQMATEFQAGPVTVTI